MEYTGPPALVLYVIAVLAFALIVTWGILILTYRNWAKDTHNLNALVDKKQRRIDLLEEMVDMSPTPGPTPTHDVPTVALMKHTRVRKDRDHG